MSATPPSRRDRERRRVTLEEPTRKQLMKNSQCEVEEDSKDVVDLDQMEDSKPDMKQEQQRTPGQRSSSRIASLNSRKTEVIEVPRSPLSVRKTVKTSRKVTVKEKKVVKLEIEKTGEEDVKQEVEKVVEDVQVKKEVKVKKEAKVKKEVKEKNEVREKNEVKKDEVKEKNEVQGEAAVEEEEIKDKKKRAKKEGKKESKKRVVKQAKAEDEADGGEVLDSKSEDDREAVVTTGADLALMANQLVERQKLSDALQVKATIRIFNSMYLAAIQEEDKRALEQAKKKDEPGKRPSKRPDLKAISKMLKLKATLNPVKQIGGIAGVSVGQQFLSRAEMVVIGLHNHWLNGIDYIGTGRGTMQGWPDVVLPITVSIVMSGGYEDDVDNSEDVIYTGQGGNNLTGDRRQIKDQKMTKGNLALKNSMNHHTPVRVIRGHADKLSYTGKVYTFDGLYEVYDHWAEKGISGFTVFKYKLRRLPGQPILTSKQVEFSRGKVPNSVSDLRGLVCKDISNGLERIPVPASNTVDDPPLPPIDYTYLVKTIIPKDISKPAPAKGCSCKGSCTDDQKCACARKNGSSIPYVFNHGGRLVKPMDVVYECGAGCGCGPECINRTSQQGLQFRLEVYKTVSKGWACRSWDFIPAGAPICEYFGTLRRNDEHLESMLDNSYIFELDLVQTMQGMEGRQKRFGDVVPELNDQDDLMQDAPMYVLDAGKCGGVSRFLNHSCEPNVFIQCVLSDHNDVTMPRIVMFAADNIHPLEELCYDYGYAMDSVVLADGSVKEMPCYCGAASCRKRMY